MQLLLVGDNERLPLSMRELLSRTGDGHLDLDHALSTEEALIRLGQTHLRSVVMRIQIGRWRRHCACCTNYAGSILAPR